MDAYIRGKVLGKGSFGSAILVQSKKDGKNYVIKEIDISKMPASERESSKQEAQLLMALKHPNIVRCLECFTHANKLCIVMDWCSEGDLYGILQKRRGQQLSEDMIMDWLVQICLGLKHVHDRKILHRDIKSQNVFVSAGGLLKLGDFGVSKILSSTWQLAATAVGTPYYLSPEICQNKKYNQKSDIWSLGCLLYEMATMKHAFEAPNMRALIQKIIKGQYPPLPSTRSKDMRDLVDRMLTLDWQKRPSINEILATPVMKARIQKFLSTTIQDHEFSHTIIHGKPKPGHLVVQAAANLPPSAFPDQMIAAQKAIPGPQTAAALAHRASQGSGATGNTAQRAPNGAAAAMAQPRPLLAGARPSALVGRPPSPRASPSVVAQKAPPAAALRPASGSRGAPAPVAVQNRVSSQLANRAVPPSAAVRPTSAALAANDVLIAKHREDEARKARDAAALGAHREVERMKLEDQRRKLEQDRARMESDRRKAEAKRAEDERRAKAAEEMKQRAAAEADKKQRDDANRRKKAEEEARKRDAERQAKDKERADMHAKIAAQKQEYNERQTAAARNKATAQEQLRGVPIAVHFPAADGGQQQRKQWQNVEVPEPKNNEWCSDRPKRGGVDLSPEQRRAAWEEMQEAARRNRQQSGINERQGQAGGLAAFLGVPDGPKQGDVVKRVAAAYLSPEERRKAYAEGADAALNNRRQVEDVKANPVRTSPGVHDGAYFERKKAKLEEERATREQEIREFQRAHYREMRDAAERNRRQIMSDIGAEKTSENDARRPSPPGSRPISEAQEAEDPDDFAAMVKDMRDVLMESDGPDDHQNVHIGGQHLAALVEGDEDEEGPMEAAALNGRFVLNGEEIRLPVLPTDPLGVKVEALKVFLERALGSGPFLKVYRRLESLCVDDDEAEVSREFLNVLGQDKLAYLGLVHQLIVCEEQWAQ